MYTGFTPAIINAPIFPLFMSATSFVTAASLPWRVKIVVLGSNALLLKKVFICKIKDWELTSWTPVKTTAPDPAFNNSLAAASTADSILGGSVTLTYSPVSLA